MCMASDIEILFKPQCELEELDLVVLDDFELELLVVFLVAISFPPIFVIIIYVFKKNVYYYSYFIYKKIKNVNNL